jgi:predicted metal-dependent enzyme (double-stranded beta helix superfamily)
VTTATLHVERDLGLEVIVASWAFEPQRWAHLVRFAEPRVRIPLYADEEFEVRLLTWLPGQASGLHDHGGSSGCMRIIAGTMSESIVNFDGSLVELCHVAGQTSSFRKDIIHSVRNAGNEPAVTIHAYRPPTHVAHRYEIIEGVLRTSD